MFEDLQLSSSDLLLGCYEITYEVFTEVLSSSIADLFDAKIVIIIQDSKSLSHVPQYFALHA
jgi:hypothetical protein